MPNEYGARSWRVQAGTWRCQSVIRERTSRGRAVPPHEGWRVHGHDRGTADLLMRPAAHRCRHGSLVRVERRQHGPAVAVAGSSQNRAHPLMLAGEVEVGLGDVPPARGCWTRAGERTPELATCVPVILHVVV